MKYLAVLLLGLAAIQASPLGHKNVLVHKSLESLYGDSGKFPQVERGSFLKHINFIGGHHENENSEEIENDVPHMLETLTFHEHVDKRNLPFLVHRLVNTLQSHDHEEKIIVEILRHMLEERDVELDRHNLPHLVHEMLHVLQLRKLNEIVEGLNEIPPEDSLEEHLGHHVYDDDDDDVVQGVRHSPYHHNVPDMVDQIVNEYHNQNRQHYLTQQDITNLLQTVSKHPHIQQQVHDYLHNSDEDNDYSYGLDVNSLESGELGVHRGGRYDGFFKQLWSSHLPVPKKLALQNQFLQYGGDNYAAIGGQRRNIMHV